MAQSDFTARRAAFRKLHESGCFMIPNPWDSVLWNIADWVKTGA